MSGEGTAELTVKRRTALQLDWEKRLYKVMVEIEKANGERSDDMEALIRLAWREVYRDNEKKRNRPSI